MKFLFLLVAIAIFQCNLFAQNNNSAVKLDSLNLFVRNLQDENELIPFPPGNSQYKDALIEVTIQFKVSNFTNLKVIEVSLANEKGKKDFKSWNLDYIFADGKSYLSMKGNNYEIINSKVTITDQVSAALLKRKLYFSVKGIDTEKKSSNILIQEFN